MAWHDDDDEYGLSIVYYVKLVLNISSPIQISNLKYIYGGVHRDR